MSTKHLFMIVGLGSLPLAGCLSPVRQDTDALVCRRAGQSLDLLPPEMVPPVKEVKPPIKPPPEKPNLEQRLEMPPAVPGAGAPRLDLPKDWRKGDEKTKDALLSKFFPPQLAIGGDRDPTPAPGPDGRPLTLGDLQKIARENSPLLRQAASDIKAFEGAAIQAGVYPNPTLGYSTNAISLTSGSTAGPSITQLIKTMGKLGLAQAAANVDLINSQIAYRRAETDLMAQVRQYYFGVLVAQEWIRANRGLVELTDEIYKVMKQQLKGGEVATYEPAQVGVFAGQARMALVTSQNNYFLAWKQLAAAMGRPEMPATELAGSLDQNLPRFDFDKTLAHILENHTDALTAKYSIEKARYLLRLAEVTPVPDVSVQMTVLYDATQPGPPRWVPVFSGGVTLPIFDRNRGGIMQAQAALLRANEEPHRVQTALTASVADAFRRTDENRRFLELYRTQLLPQQAQAFRAVVQRHFGGGVGDAAAPAFNDLIAAEQNVVMLMGTYLTTLQSYWQAVSDQASWLQTDDVYKMAVEVQSYPVPALDELLKLPCCHPCSGQTHPAPNATLHFESTPAQPVVPAPNMPISAPSGLQTSSASAGNVTAPVAWQPLLGPPEGVTAPSARVTP